MAIISYISFTTSINLLANYNTRSWIRFWNVVTVSFGAIAYSYLCFILFLGTRPRWIKYEVAQKFHRVLPILAIAAILLHSQTEDFVNNPDGLHGAGGYGELSQNVFLIMGGLVSYS